MVGRQPCGTHALQLPCRRTSAAWASSSRAASASSACRPAGAAAAAPGAAAGAGATASAGAAAAAGATARAAVTAAATAAAVASAAPAALEAGAAAVAGAGAAASGAAPLALSSARSLRACSWRAGAWALGGCTCRHSPQRLRSSPAAPHQPQRQQQRRRRCPAVHTRQQGGEAQVFLQVGVAQRQQVTPRNGIALEGVHRRGREVQVVQKLRNLGHRPGCNILWQLCHSGLEASCMGQEGRGTECDE